MIDSLCFEQFIPLTSSKIKSLTLLGRVNGSITFQYRDLDLVLPSNIALVFWYLLLTFVRRRDWGFRHFLLVRSLARSGCCISSVDFGPDFDLLIHCMVKRFTGRIYNSLKAMRSLLKSVSTLSTTCQTNANILSKLEPVNQFIQ